LLVPNTQVFLGSFTGFTLDDPVLGLLDEGILDGGIDFDDVSEGVFAVSCKRGRNRDLERTTAGQLSVSFRNQSRLFDPTNPDSPFVRFVVPRRPVRVEVDGEPVFQGFVDNWAFDYEPGGDSVASFSASDGFSVFARNVNGGS
jgi:hypothetical protein